MPNHQLTPLSAPTSHTYSISDFWGELSLIPMFNYYYVRFMSDRKSGYKKNEPESN